MFWAKNHFCFLMVMASEEGEVGRHVIHVQNKKCPNFVCLFVSLRGVAAFSELCWSISFKDRHFYLWLNIIYTSFGKQMGAFLRDALLFSIPKRDSCNISSLFCKAMRLSLFCKVFLFYTWKRHTHTEYWSFGITQFAVISLICQK